jgi:heme-degrading monooxygenase HmoA
MFVRTMYITTDPAEVERATESIAKSVPGMLYDKDGYQGFGMFADFAVGKILTGSWWESEQAMRSSDDQLRDRRAEMLAPLVSTVATMGFEAVAYTRPASASSGGFRLQRMMFDPSQADRLIATFNEMGLPRLKELDGFQGATMLMDRQRGMASVGVIFQDMDKLAASRGPQAAIRKAAFAQMSGPQLIALEEMEVVDLEVPSSAMGG